MVAPARPAVRHLRPLPRRRLRALAVVGALLAASSLAAPAGATVPLPDCDPGDGWFVFVAPTEAVTGPLSVGLQALDGCDEPDPTFVGTVVVQTEQLDGRFPSETAVTFEAEDEGFVQADVQVPSQGLTYLNVLDSTSELFLGGHELLVSGPGRHPVVEDLAVVVAGGSYRASGVTADIDMPGVPLSVSVVVDVTEVRRVAADLPSDLWEFAPDTVGADHGFELAVTVPQGRHSVCLVVDDVVAGGGPLVPRTVDCRVVDVAGPPPVPGPPVGGLDGLFRVPDGLVAAGWAVDPARTGGTTDVVSRATFRSPSGGGGQVAPQPASAVLPRADVAAAYPQFGPDHGFRSMVYPGGDGTSYEVCVSAAATALGCRSAVIDRDPLGALDSASPAPTGVAVRGWALDQDTYDAIDVHVYVDGALAAVVPSSAYRADVAAAFPAAAGGIVRGYGGDHGFAATVPAGPGRHSVCAYGITVDRFPGDGRNTLLGCRDVVVPATSPLGAVDTATPVPGGFTLRGWAADPDAPTTPLQVHTYRDGVGAAITTADQTRPDLLALDGGRYGTGHGFSTGTVTTGPTARVCSYAINVGPGTNTALRCLDLTRRLTPTGTLDEATRTSPTQVSLRGWALDPDTAAPVDIHVYVDGRPAAVTSATSSRGDIAAAFPGWGAAHGYTLTVPATPGQRVCSYAINTLQGTDNTTLGCRTV